MLYVVAQGCAQTRIPNDDVTTRGSIATNYDEADLGGGVYFGLLAKGSVDFGWLEFTFGAAPTDSATLNLYNYWTNASSPVDWDIVVRGEAFNFDEAALTGANKPNASGWSHAAGPFHVDNTQQTYGIDITAFYNAHLNETMTLRLEATSGSGDGPIFVDREGTGGYAQTPTIDVEPSAPLPPVIAEITLDPDTATAGIGYVRQLALTQGTPPVTWQVFQGPSGLVVDATGWVSGWTPAVAEVGQLASIQILASNTSGLDAETWQVEVLPPPDTTLHGWLVEYFSPGGDVTDFPNFDTLLPKAVAIVPDIDQTPTIEQFVPQGFEFLDDFAVRYQCEIALPAGTTTFYVTSDDGARLYVDGTQVVDHGGVHGFTEAVGAIALTAGMHCVVVAYFDHLGSAGLRVEYAPPGGVREVIPAPVTEPSLCLAGTVTVPKWRMFEIALTAVGTPTNPFTDTTLTATVTAPDGRVLTVDGFHDGDGKGGQVGSIWKLRLTPDQLGSWQWVTDSSDAGLDGRGSVFECVASGDAGPLAANGRRFEQLDGNPVYLIGNFLDRAAPAQEEFSHTLLSEEISDANRQDMITRQRDFHRANKMNVYIANLGDYGHISTTPWLGSDVANDKTRFDLARWRMYEQRVAQLADEGMFAELWFFADDSSFGSLPDADRQRLIHYGMARFSAYAHTMFVLTLEWQEGWSSGEVNTHAAFLQVHNPWGRLASTHGTTGNFAFPNQPWADFMATQSGNSIDPPGNNAHTITNRALADKPLIVEEFGLLDIDTDKRLRGNLWAAFCGGAAGSGTGSDLLRLREFIEDTAIAYWSMAPNNSLADHGFVLADPGLEYVVYVENGDPLTLQLAAGTYASRWFSPRTADGDAGPRSADLITGGTVMLTPPNTDDWVLHIRRCPGNICPVPVITDNALFVLFMLIGTASAPIFRRAHRQNIAFDSYEPIGKQTE
jgi:hypothetical protein